MRTAAGEFCWEKINYTSIFDDNGMLVRTFRELEQMRTVFPGRYAVLKEKRVTTFAAVALHGLKLDKALTNDLYVNAKARLLVEDFGCTYAQGYLFNKPIPVPDFERKYMKLLYE